MIKDTCPCGASLEVQDEKYHPEQQTHQAWLDAHKGCRNATFADLDPPPAEWPSVTVDCEVKSVKTAYLSENPIMITCSVIDIQTGDAVEGVPCDGLNLIPGDIITIDVRKQEANHGG